MKKNKIKNKMYAYNEYCFNLFLFRQWLSSIQFFIPATELRELLLIVIDPNYNDREAKYLFHLPKFFSYHRTDLIVFLFV